MVEVSGVIRDRDGLGVPDVDVLLDTTDDGDYGGGSGPAASTDRRGEFRMHVERGRYRWVLLASHTRIPTVFGDTVQLTEREERLDYRYEGLRVDGRILGPDGTPMKVGSVEASGTDPNSRRGINLTGVLENGRYRMFLPKSSFWFHANPYPERYAKVENRPQISISADTTIDFAITGHLVTGRAMLGPSKPLAGAEVVVMGGGDSLMISARDRTRRNGRFEVCLPSGPYGIVLQPGLSDKHIAPRTYQVTVDGPQTVSLNAAGIVWRGTVRDSTTGMPLRSVNVLATDIWLSNPLVCKTDGRGRFMFVLEPGRKYALAVRHSSLPFGRDQAKAIAASKDSTFDLFVGGPRSLK